MLSPRKKKLLAGEAQSLPSLLQVGKQGVTDAFVNELKIMIKKKRLVKVKFLKSVVDDVVLRVVAQEIAEKAGLDVVQVVGHTVIFYDPRAEKKQ